jgi:5'(3')-deoxyribonucleotidase
MRIVVDLDGVCYEFDKTARYMMRTYLGLPDLDTEAQYWDDLKDRVPQSAWRWLWNEGVELGLFRYGHMVQGTRLGLNKLVEEGHEIVFATHRPKHAVQDTVDWLSLYMKDIPYTGLHFMSNGEEKHTIHADVLVDDKPENVVNWYYFGDGKAILFDRAWNRELEAEFDNGLYIAKGWDQVVRKIDAIN